jgi:copper transporter 1
MFAGSCIGVIFLVMSLEFLRRLSKEYDRYIIKQARAKFLVPDPHSSEENLPGKTPTCASVSTTPACRPNTSFKPNLLQQMIRATLHMLQFAVAYFVMLLAMYYNGYIIICIFIGAWIGGFIFQWETISLT